MQLNVKTNAPEFRRLMLQEQRSQLPFATARALTWTGRDATQAVESRINQAFDRPTRFTQRSVASQPATRAKLFSRVLIKDTQAAYLGIQEEGGTRTPKRKALVVPFNAKLNQYGNLPRGGVRRLLARQDTFSGTVRGIGGIWQRTRDGGVKLLIAYEQKAKYRPRFEFARTVEEVARQKFPDNFERSFREAMQTAR